MQFLYRLKFEYAVILIAMGAFVSAVVFATDGDLAPIQAPVNNKPIYNATQGAIEVEVSPNRATVAGTTSCELLGNPINQAFQGSSRYRANVISIEQSTDITSFEMDLTIIQNTTLQFTVHERQTDGTFKLIASKTRTNVIGDMFHSSGLFSSTVSLQAGKTYAFGTTWNTNVNYYIGGPLLPAPFATGEILGWISRNSVTIPIGNLPNLGINDSPGSGTYSMRICLPPAPGACCQPKADGSGGECVDVFEDQCFIPGSTFHGQRTKCSATLCEFGACCLPCGGSDCLAHYTPLACRNESGDTATHWPGLDCGDVSLCEPVTGACCVSETCTELCKEDCLNPFVGGGAGTYHGDGTDCESNVCIGACCKDKTCQNKTATACLNLIEGVFHGEGTTCETLDPSVGCGTGACCFTNEFDLPDCDIVESRSDCSEEVQGRIDAVYKGDGSVCEYVKKCVGGDIPGAACSTDNDCPPTNVPNVQNGFCREDLDDVICPDPATISGCCLPNGTCINTTSTFCNLPWVGGMYNSTQLCEDPTFACSGFACCLSDGSCLETTIKGCNVNYHGTFTGIPTCDTGTCSNISALKGACCGSDTGDCQLLTKTDCKIQNRTFVGGDCNTPALTCPGNGACCTPNNASDDDDYCFDDVSEARCGVIDGMYLNDGSSCDVGAGVCDVRSACCTPSGKCRSLLAQECNFLQGVFHLDTDCTDDPCISGACCLGGGDCSIRIWEACQANNETYLGDDIPCSGDACGVGSCCKADGTCEDGLLISECDVANGELYDQTITCAELDTPCSPIGACCLGAFSCVEMRQPDCETAGGVYQGDFACDEAGEICRPGACCLSDLSCVDSTYTTICELQPDSTFIGNEFCANRPCDPTGACCLNGACSIENQFDCEQEGGTYFGDDKPCDANICRLGACCQLNGTCNDNVLSATCTGIDDVFRTDRTCLQFCIARGACCLDGTCSVTTRLLCENAGGNYESDGSVCRDRENLCTVGACCMPVGENACNEFTELECIQSNGIYQGPASDCTAIREAQGCLRSACCHLDGTCDDLTVISECPEPSTFYTERKRCNEIDCDPRGACCFEDETCEILTSPICLGSGGVYIDAEILCTPDACITCRPVMTNTTPPNCAIDARYPHDPIDSNAKLGWDEIVIEFDCDPSSVSPSDFAITGPDAPMVITVLAAGAPNTYILTLSSPIGAGNWTEILHIPSGSFMKLGSLPGDANGDFISNADDVIALIDHINGDISLDDWKCDVDHSGACESGDLLALINLLNGAEMFDEWMDATIFACPTSPTGP